MSNLEKIVESVKIVKEKNYRGIVHKILVSLKSGISTKLSIPDDDIQLIKALKATGNDQPVKSLNLVEDTTEDGEKYFCVKMELCDGSILRYFFPNFTFKKSIEILLRAEEEKDKVKTPANGEVKNK